ncbi:hypothetical protein NDU88_003258 [Pleurodeles waltl]|uniref:Uncharacterized protein n=1 Tax=Pleurodeles waltl TaxID=8319 RepID=A0AAV7T4S5_PLEWA|nr:hypothetical protein NDU88_003258 [Pleurodeles waltl]
MTVAQTPFCSVTEPPGPVLYGYTFALVELQLQGVCSRRGPADRFTLPQMYIDMGTSRLPHLSFGKGLLGIQRCSIPSTAAPALHLDPQCRPSVLLGPAAADALERRDAAWDCLLDRRHSLIAEESKALEEQLSIEELREAVQRMACGRFCDQMGCRWSTTKHFQSYFFPVY